ncbi:TrmH family RNA methyltransferase [Lagierella massiliensis]|uniref:TrmH family RNA methyltransferase n=1 Tax=Lagierella massiliensis TaxID=1689303 RepID=UPI0006D84BF3|nr:TrmH family RNA methyltransferase [Lagierella massiliensis]
MTKLKKYRKDFEYSYVLGPFPTLELVDSRREIVEKVYISPEFNEIEKVSEKLDKLSIPYEISQDNLNRISLKKKEYMAATFKKYHSEIENEKNHIILDRVSDMGNLGTIIRTMVGFGYRDIALIGNCCDIFNPKVIRGSMGSFFKINFEKFSTIDEYRKKYDNEIFAFMLDDDAKLLQDTTFTKKFSLAFGNEGSGLGEEYKVDDIKKVIIPQSEDVDSLNLTIAAAVAMYEAKK